MQTINVVFQVFAIVSMVPVSSGFEEWIHVFCNNIHLAKRETL